jgi:hypothetical protein
MSHEIFETNPNLEKVHVTSDNTPFYQENDAKNHAKCLKDKTVETVYNPKSLEQKEADDKAKLAESLLAFDPETTKYPEAAKLFKALGLEAENVKAETIYPLLAAAKASAQEGVKNQD